MKKRGIMGMLLLVVLLVSTFACSGGEETPTQPVAEAIRGNTNVTVTGDGNIEASSHSRLTFSSGGKVAKIFVNEGDEVTKGESLASLDIAPLGLSLIQAQATLAQAQATLAQAQVTQLQAQIAQAPAQVTLSQAQAALTQAQASRTQAQIVFNLAEDNLEDAEDLYRRLKRFLDRNDSKLEDAEVLFETAELEFEVAGTQLAAADIQLETAELEFEVAGIQLTVVEPQIEAANLHVEAANLHVEAAEQAVRQAQKQLVEATITAPFDGMIARVGVKEGEFISPAAYTGTTIVEIIDLRHMELTARVDELDVVKVKTGQKVMISVDAMPEAKLEGLVTFISPVAREPGAVLFEDEDEEKEYEVKIDFDIPENSPIRAGMSATAEIIVE